MGSILNPSMNNSFTKLAQRKDKYLFVDKTEFIYETNKRLNEEDCFLTVTRPRRFGKTVTARMLATYYSKSFANQNIFEGLKITGPELDNANKNDKERAKELRDSYEKHLNKYDVIYIDMNSIRDKYIAYTKDEDLQVKGVTTLVDFLQYSIIEDLKDNEDYAEQLNKSKKVGKMNLTSALEVLCSYTKEKFIMIMDEWDLVYRDYRDDIQLQKEFIDFLRGLFKSDDGQACFALAYLTGILPIKKYNSQSALNSFDEYNMLTPGEYAPFFGFTDEEVDGIVKSYNCKVSLQDLKKWYEGYKIKGVDIYNPNSVCKAVSRNECISYWSGTSSNEEVIRLINLNFKGIKTDITKLIDGIKIPFSSNNFQNDMVTINDKNDIFSLLVCLGYLGCIERRNGLKSAYVPNQEIKQTLLSIVKGQKWSRRTVIVKRSEDLLNAIIKTQDGQKVAEIIQEVHNSSAVSLLDYNSEESLTYCVMTAMQWATLDIYDYYREEQSGKGRTDLVYDPGENDEYPLIIIEFKYGKSATEAIEQIKTQEYYRRYTERYRRIIIVGINYSRDTKDHECVIEKLY